MHTQWCSSMFTTNRSRVSSYYTIFSGPDTVIFLKTNKQKTDYIDFVFLCYNKSLTTLTTVLLKWDCTYCFYLIILISTLTFCFCFFVSDFAIEFSPLFPIVSNDPLLSCLKVSCLFEDLGWGRILWFFFFFYAIWYIKKMNSLFFSL